MDIQPKNNPITDKEDVNSHPDPKIDQDFKGYPHGPANDKIIKPETPEEKEVADIQNKDGEKREDTGGKIQTSSNRTALQTHLKANSKQ